MHQVLVIPAFFLRKKGILISYQSQSVVGQSALTNGPLLGTLNFRNFTIILVQIDHEILSKVILLPLIQEGLLSVTT